MKKNLYNMKKIFQLKIKDIVVKTRYQIFKISKELKEKVEKALQIGNIPLK